MSGPAAGTAKTRCEHRPHLPGVRRAPFTCIFHPQGSCRFCACGSSRPPAPNSHAPGELHWVLTETPGGDSSSPLQLSARKHCRRRNGTPLGTCRSCQNFAFQRRLRSCRQSTLAKPSPSPSEAPPVPQPQLAGRRRCLAAGCERKTLTKP